MRAVRGPRRGDAGQGPHALRAAAPLDRGLPADDVRFGSLVAALLEGGGPRVLRQVLRRRAKKFSALDITMMCLSFLRTPRRLHLADAEGRSSLAQLAVNIHFERMRVTEHAPRIPCRHLERRHGLVKIVERGAVGSASGLSGRRENTRGSETPTSSRPA